MADKAKLSLKDVGLQDCDFKTGELWGFAGYKKRDEGVAVGFLQGFDIVELDTELNLGWSFKTMSAIEILCYIRLTQLGQPALICRTCAGGFMYMLFQCSHMGYVPISEL